MKKETIRKLGIALAAILGPGALLYLSGLVAQLQINYEDWLHSGGMTGTAHRCSITRSTASATPLLPPDFAQRC